MRVLGRISVFPVINPQISRLHELAFNLWWSWHPEAQELYRQIDPTLWRESCHNPVRFLEQVAPQGAVYRHNDFNVRTINMTVDECANAHAHCRQLLMAASETIPVVDGEACLGTWQRIFLVELDHPRERSVIVQVTGQG